MEAVVGVQLLRDDVFVEILDVLPSDIIIVPDAYKGMPVRGRILEIGPKQWDVKPGEVVQFYFGGVRVHYPDKKHAIVEAPYMQCVLTE